MWICQYYATLWLAFRLSIIPVFHYSILPFFHCRIVEFPHLPFSLSSILSSLCFSVLSVPPCLIFPILPSFLPFQYSIFPIFQSSILPPVSHQWFIFHKQITHFLVHRSQTQIPKKPPKYFYQNICSNQKKCTLAHFLTHNKRQTITHNTSQKISKTQTFFAS